MEKLGIIRRSSSSWSSPLHMVEKKTPGAWRPCGDYRCLNEATTHDHYPVPHIQDFSAQLKGQTIFSKIDLVRGYNQIPMTAADVPKTAVVTPFGLFEFLRMPFGLKNAVQAFQRFMDQVCRGLEDFLFVYLDDILVASANAKEHKRHLRASFSRDWRSMDWSLMWQSVPLVLPSSTSSAIESEYTESNHYLSELRLFAVSQHRVMPKPSMSSWGW